MRALPDPEEIDTRMRYQDLDFPVQRGNRLRRGLKAAAGVP
jgi:hypothetical protein